MYIVIMQSIIPKLNMRCLFPLFLKELLDSSAPLV